MSMNMKKPTKPAKQVELNSIDLPLSAPADQKSDKSVEKLSVIIGSEEDPSTDVKEYNHAAAQEKAWAKIMEVKKPKLTARALEAMYAHNTEHPAEAVKTVCLSDSTGAACNVSLKDTYAKASHDPAEAIAALRLLGKADPNQYIAERVVVGFDTSIFYNEDGSIKRSLYLDMMNAIQAVATNYGVESPFTSKKVVSTKPDFGDKRWTDFTEEQQPMVTKSFPATVSVTPIAPEKHPKA